MVDKIVASVPARIWEEGRPGKQKLWDVEYNVASWVRINGAQGDVALAVHYEDEAGSHQHQVDRAAVNSESSHLMSGLIKLRLTGKVSRFDMVLSLSNPAMRHQVDELFIQRKGSALSRETKLISNY